MALTALQGRFSVADPSLGGCLLVKKYQYIGAPERVNTKCCASTAIKPLSVGRYHKKEREFKGVANRDAPKIFFMLNHNRRIAPLA